MCFAIATSSPDWDWTGTGTGTGALAPQRVLQQPGTGGLKGHGCSAFIGTRSLAPRGVVASDGSVDGGGGWEKRRAQVLIAADHWTAAVARIRPLPSCQLATGASTSTCAAGHGRPFAFLHWTLVTWDGRESSIIRGPQVSIASPRAATTQLSMPSLVVLRVLQPDRSAPPAPSRSRGPAVALSGIRRKKYISKWHYILVLDRTTSLWTQWQLLHCHLAGAVHATCGGLRTAASGHRNGPTRW